MKSDKLLDAIGQIDEKFVADAGTPPKKAKTVWLRLVAVAACLALVVGGVLLALPTAPVTPPIDTDSTPPKDYPNANLSAEEAASAFPVYDNSTSAYHTVCMPTNKAPALAPLPTDGQLSVYSFKKQTTPLSKAELDTFADGILPKLTAALGVSVADYEKKESSDKNRLDISYRDGDSNLNFEQSNGDSDYGIEFADNRVFVTDENITLNGTPLQIDRTQSEAAILASLSEVRDTLFTVFGCSFDSASVDFDYRDYGDSGAWNIYVNYYNQADAAYGSIYRGDRLSLRFNNEYLDSPLEDPNTLLCRSISYTSLRRPVEDYLAETRACNRMPLEEAENYLRAGYVFGGYYCPICMADQEKVSSDNYDYVGFEYVSELYNPSPKAVPFYAFYKKIGNAENGNALYAKTYVCAVEVSGMREYVEKQANRHKLMDKTENVDNTSSLPKVYPDANLTAEEAVTVFTKDANENLAYHAVYRPAGEAPDNTTLPNDAKLNAYTFKKQITPLSETEFAAFTDRISPKLTNTLGITVADSAWQKSADKNSLDLTYQNDDVRLNFTQTSGDSTTGMSFAKQIASFSVNNNAIALNGTPVQVDRRQSEAEILASLAAVSDTLFDIFGCSFNTARVRYTYVGNGDDGDANSIFVEYYNKTAVVYDSIIYDEHISLRFSNERLDSPPDDPALTANCLITYVSYRRPFTNYIASMIACNRLSLEDAKAFLKAGYLFSGHACALCLTEPTAVKFDDYDYVGFEYKDGFYDGDPARIIPYYTFYKKVGTAPNGNIIYAKTYVCAIELSGVRDYFEKQTSAHQKLYDDTSVKEQ